MFYVMFIKFQEKNNSFQHSHNTIKYLIIFIVNKHLNLIKERLLLSLKNNMKNKLKNSSSVIVIYYQLINIKYI